MTNMQRPASQTLALQPPSHPGGCFNTSAHGQQRPAPAGVVSEVYSVERTAATEGLQGMGTVQLADVAGEMLLLRLPLPLQEAPGFVQLPRWLEAASGPSIAAARGALSSPGLLYFAVRYLSC